MKSKMLGLTVSAAVAFNIAYADTAQQQQLDNLQAEIKQLNQQVSNVKHLSNIPIIMTDSKLPLGAITKVHFPYAILKAKSILNAPLIVGGQVEADAQVWNGSYLYNGNAQDGTSVAFTKWYLFNLVNINSWTTGVITLKNSLPANGVQTDRAFLTFGNFSQSPWYFTVGNAYLPFGSFSGNGPLDNSLTTNAFRISPTTQAMLGLNAEGFNTDFGLYSDSTFNNGLHNFLFNTEWAGTLTSHSNIVLGGGYLNDIRGTNSGVGAAYTNATPNASSPLTAAATGAYDGNITLNLGNLSLLWEFVKTSTAPTVNDQQQIGKPGVWMLGTIYKSVLLNWPTQYQLSFSQSQNMQNIPLPLALDFAQNLKATGIKTEWLASIDSQVWNNVYIGPELDYDHMYLGTNNWTLTLDATAYF